MKLLLDTSILGWVCHPRKHGDVRAWLQSAVVAHDVLISEVADHELRRELLRIGALRSIANLDELARELVYESGQSAIEAHTARSWLGHSSRAEQS